MSIAHRGNSLFAPENTLAACLAAAGKADLVEIDVRVTSDGKLVLMHDSTVNRTTDGSGTVAGQTQAELQLLDAGSWFDASFASERIPLLAEMITNTLPFAVPLIEHKAGTASAYVQELQRLGVVTNVVLQSFDWNFLASVHALAPEIQLCALGSGGFSAATLQTITNTGARTVAWEKSSVTLELLEMLHAHGLALFVWTVDGPDIQNFIELGVDGIISNDPGMVRRLQQHPTNAPVNLAEDLVAYWKLDDGLTIPFASSIADSKGTNTGNLVRNDGASHWFDAGVAKLGGCLKVEGTNAYGTFPASVQLDINTNGLTFAAWVWLPVLPAQIATSFGAVFDSSSDCYVLYLDRANQELRFKVSDAAGHAARPGIPQSRLETNRWLHVAATYAGAVGPVSGQATIYLDGRPQDVHTGNDGSSPFGLTGWVKPGQLAAMGREGPSGGNYFTGFLDDVAIWKRALTPAEVRQLFEAGEASQSLGALLRQPTKEIQFTSVHPTSPPKGLAIQFKSLGPWQSFRLLRASQFSGPFLAVDGILPVELGNDEFRFEVQSGSNAMEFYRIEGF